MNKLFSCALTVALSLAALPAVASTISLGGTAVAGAGVTSSVVGSAVQNFDSGVLPANYLVNGPGGIVSGSIVNVYKAPTADTSKYLTTGTGSVTATSLNGVNYLGFYWGSVDNFNTLVLTTTVGTETYTGASIAALGFTVNSENSTYVNFFADEGVSYKSVQFSSSQNAFEVDNVATATPEPASLAMIATGFVALGAGLIRRRKQV